MKILVEKPIFDKPQKIINFKNKNIFVGYNFRFNPIINYLKNYFKKNNSFICDIECGYYLPFWKKVIIKIPIMQIKKGWWCFIRS